MTPKEKAMELIDKFENIVPTIDGHYSYQEMIEEHFNKSKQCALIVVETVILNCYEKEEYYWREVEQEIEKL
jgi:hypothetical protein